MGWQIQIEKEPLKYRLNGKVYYTQGIKEIEHQIDYEPSSEYKAHDTIVTDIYRAKSQHGTFEWTITASLRGFDSQAHIDDIILTRCPPDCELEDDLTAVIEEYNDWND